MVKVRQTWFFVFIVLFAELIMGRSQRKSIHPRHSIPTQKNRPNPSFLPISLAYHSLSQKHRQSTIIEHALFLASLPSLNLGNVWSIRTVRYSLSLRTLIISDCTVPAYTACDHRADDDPQRHHHQSMSTPSTPTPDDDEFR